jgi:hypothetical protein
MEDKKNRQDGVEEDRKIIIDELLDNIHEIETVNAQDGSDLLHGELSPEEGDRIWNRVLAKMGTEKNEKAQIRTVNRTKRRAPKKRLLAAAVATVFIFVTSAWAAEVFEWDKRIANYLGINTGNSAKLAESGMLVGASAEQKGVTIKAVQTLGDAHNMYVLFDVTSPEGTRIAPNSGFEMIYLKVDGATSLGYSCDFLPDESENDNRAAMLLTMSANKDINDKKINLRFKDLRHYMGAEKGYVTDVEGIWELEWKLDYKDSSLKYPVDQKLTVNGETVNVDVVEISPIAVNVKISGDYIKEYDSVPPDPEAGDLIQITAVTLKDGTVLTQKDSSGWGTSTEGDEYKISMQMKKLIDQEQVESITLDDTLISLRRK